MKTRQEALELDRYDPLAHLGEQFALPSGIIYLDGNSLGATPRSAAARAQAVIHTEWGTDLVRSWNSAGWSTLPGRLGNKLAPLIGAEPDEVVVTDSISVNLFKLLSAMLRAQAQRAPKRRVIVSERSNFPTDLYIAQGLIAQLEAGYILRLVDDPADLPAALNNDTAIVMLTHVNYRSGYMHDMAALTPMIQRSGALALWDLAHSAGSVPLDMNSVGADGAVGCTYKYLNGGPGAPAFVWVPRRHHGTFEQPLSGWWGHRAPFAMQPEFEPIPGIARFLCGTPSILSMALVECGLDIFLQTDMHAIRRKSLALTDAFIALVETRCTSHALQLITPRAHGQRGSQVSFEHPHGYPVMQALNARGVIGDYREPNVLRFGFTPLYTRFIDVWDTVEMLHDILSTAAWQAPEFAIRKAVT